MKILFIGSVEFSYQLLKTVYRKTKAEIVGIVSKEESKFNSDFKSLIPFAIENEIPYFIYKNNKQLTEDLSQLNYDVIYCFGWSHLLPINIIKSAKHGAIGYHPALLPENRGRHPIIWALALGMSETGSTFFFMNEDADSGDILSQVKVPININDTAMSLYNKLQNAAEEQVIHMTDGLISKSIRPITQQNYKANYWRKRSKEDGLIDWRMSSTNINNLVRALSKPYVGAHIIYRGNEIKIWKVRIKEIINKRNIEPGKILHVSKEKNSFDVKTGDGVIEILEHDFLQIPQEGEYLL